ncbi:MAG: hypothetical protein AAFV53_12910 [Myxococcota bacterium]
MVRTSFLIFLAGCGTIGFESPVAEELAGSADLASDEEDVQNDDDDNVVTDDEGEAQDDPDDPDDPAEEEQEEETDPEVPDVDDPPVLESMTVSDNAGILTIEFVADDLDGDLDGGVVQMTIDGVAYRLNIPGDLDVWAPGGTSSVGLDFGMCVLPTQFDVSMSVEDTTALRSDSLTTSHNPVRSGLVVDSTSYDAGMSTIYDIGALTGPVTVCGYLGSSDEYTEQDFVGFTVSTGGSRDFSLTWDTGDDIDLYLLDYETNTELTQSFNDNATPEFFSYALTSGREYYLSIAGWEADGSNWMLTID